ncbi:MAG: mevalonate kinase [Chloroflexi bacterium]|nr:mevalonate kinase [Chloroflexota bacterium]MCY4248492.1 mevalonate kinase [Chloroflexota bacterium]
MNGTVSASGKAILLGEHAVVYGRPALAIPLPQLRAVADFRQTRQALTVYAADLSHRPWQWKSDAAASPDPLVRMTALTLAHLGICAPTGEIKIRSAIPIASGLGSGAAVSAALGRGIAALCRATLANDALNVLVYEVEKLHHGRPSGIDNATVVYEQPVCFQRGQPRRAVKPTRRLDFLLADSGVPALTRESVAAVHQLLRKEPARANSLFDRIADGVVAAQARLASGDERRLGELMTANHEHLRELGVSSPLLDALVSAALQAGASGAKLSGGGRGGHIIALVEPATASAVKKALQSAGAIRVLAASLGG